MNTSTSALSGEELEQELTTPSSRLIQFVSRVEGDFIVLGAGGKMGPSLSIMLRRAMDAAAQGGRGEKKLIAVSKFSSKGTKERLRSHGIDTIAADLLNQESLVALPNVENVIDMVAQKFGTTGGEHNSWALNAFLPGRIAERFRDSRIVHFSSGNVYPFVSVKGRGSKEGDTPGPVGEYAQSRLGGERLLDYFSRKYGTLVTTLRLNYAIELRYGVLHDIAESVMEQRPIDLRMGYVNVIWQGDANDIAIRSLSAASSPPKVLNLTGPEKIQVKWLAKEFGKLLGVKPIFKNSEDDTALLNDARSTLKAFGPPRIKLSQMIAWVAEWVKRGGASLNKPTHFQDRTGRF